MDLLLAVGIVMLILSLGGGALILARWSRREEKKTTTKQKWLSALKWVGLYLLANAIGGILGVVAGLERYNSLVSAGVLLIMIGVALVSRVRRRAAWKQLQRAA